MKPKYYDIIVRAVEEGVPYGWHRAHKHEERPTPEAVQEAIASAVIDAICEVFTFDTGTSE